MSSADIDPDILALLKFLQNGAKTDPEQIKRDHKQFEKWIRGEVDEPPEIMKVKDTDIIHEITPEQERAIEPFKKAGLLGLAWKQEVRKKTNP